MTATAGEGSDRSASTSPPPARNRSSRPSWNRRRRRRRRRVSWNLRRVRCRRTDRAGFGRAGATHLTGDGAQVRVVHGGCCGDGGGRQPHLHLHFRSGRPGPLWKQPCGHRQARPDGFALGRLGGGDKEQKGAGPLRHPGQL